MDGGGDPMKMSREQYAELFGPTTGDKVRLGDTDLWIEVEKDFTNYGEEMIFGGGKTIRDGMGQNVLPHAVPDCFPSAENHFFTVIREIFFDFNP